MSNTPPQGAEPPLATLERRLGARRSVLSLAYVDFGGSNGGIILNLGEGGLAVTSAAPLDSDGPARMQFQLPGSNDRLTVRGEITWISGSGKEAGLRFIDLSKDVRSRITGWISSQEFPVAFDTTVVSREEAQPADLSPTRSVKNAIAELARANEAAHEKLQSSTCITETESPSRREEEFVRSHAEEQASSDNRRAERSLEPSDRRVYVRRQLPSLAYVDLGASNGGIIFNLGEGGLAVTSATPLNPDGLPEMRFQLPGSSDWLKVGGEIAWISRSRKEAGLRFVDLSEDVRRQITGWISSETSVLFESEEGGSREKAWRRLEMPTIPPPAVADHDRIAEATASASMPEANAAPTLFDLTKHPRLGGAVQARLGRVLLERRTWAMLALLVVLGALTSFLAGWLAAVPDPLARIWAWFGKTPSETSEAANDVESPPASAVASVPEQTVGPPPDAASAGFATKDSKSITDSVDGSRAEGSAKDFTSPGETSPARTFSPHITSPSEHVRTSPSVRTPVNIFASPGDNGTPPSPRSVAAQPQATSVPATASPVVNPPQAAKTSGTVGQESSLSTQSTRNPEVLRPSFSVNFNTYPSIHVPAGLKSQASQQGTRMEIGQLLSRVDPIYPADAEAQRVEGTVRLHIIIGPDGAIEKVEPVGGPALLIPAATNAVRQWRYTESLIGDQPVEAEQDIAITFRLTTPASGTN